MRREVIAQVGDALRFQFVEKRDNSGEIRFPKGDTRVVKNDAVTLFTLWQGESCVESHHVGLVAAVLYNNSADLLLRVDC